MKNIFFVLLLSAVVSVPSYSQYARGQMKLDFYEAEMFMLYEEYKDALPLYQGLAKIDPTNSNYKYRIGQCLINIMGSKQEAIPYLEAAVKDVNPNYREGKFKETKAPFDAYYYLANAYRINNQLEKALATYDLFRRNMDTKIYDSTIVNQQIESCRNAIELMKVPMYIRKQNLGETINDQYADLNPVVSGDQNVMVYTKLTPFQEALLYSRRENGKWSAPLNIIPDLGLGQEEGNYPTSLSQKGDELYIYRRGEDYDGNIFVTKRISEERWSNLVKLNENINTKYWESHAAVSHDGKKLYFTSNRKGTFGGLDIYVSERDSADAWGPAKNLGNVINTPANEESPFLGNDDKTLFFSSRGHFNIGGYDIFYSTLLENGQWSVPLNVGYPLNTTDEDIFFNPVEDGYQAYYSITDENGYGLSDIYKIEIFNKDHPRKFYVIGVVKVKDLLTIFGDSIKVSATSLSNPEAKVVVFADPKTGEYRFELPQGDYSLAFEAEGAERARMNLLLPLTHPTDSFVMPGTTLPKTDFMADLNVGETKNISVVKGDTISFPLKVEPNSILTVEHWQGDSLLSRETFIMTDSSFIYKTVPRTGDTRIVFSLTDKYNNTTTSEIFVSRKKVITGQQVVRPEYKRVIAEKQISAFMELAGKNADDNLRKAIQKANAGKQQFGNADDIIAYLKNEAAANNVSPSEVDLLALKIAVKENILTQAAVDLLAANSEGELKKLLLGLNIYDANLKTWSDLQEYIFQKSQGRITPDILNRIASDILAGRDPSIAVIREKILLFSEVYENGAALKEAVSATDLKSLLKSGAWFRSFWEETLKAGVRETDLCVMTAALTALQGTPPMNWLGELSGYAEKRLADWIGELDPDRIKVRTVAEMVSYLLENRDKGSYTTDELFSALAKMIADKNLSKDIIAAGAVSGEKPGLYVLWIILGAGLVAFIIILSRRKKKEHKKDKE